MGTAGNVIKRKVAVLWEQKKLFSIEEIEVAPPKAKEVRIKVLAMGICQTDAHFSVIEALGVVDSIGEGVTTMKLVIPHFLPQCRECNACHNPDGNLCIGTDITGHGVLADDSTRCTCKGKPVYYFLSTSTFTEYTAVDETSIAKTVDAAPPEKVCLTGCGFSTGYRATIKIDKVTPGSICVVFGLGGVGLSVIMGCKSAGASRIVGADLSKDKFEKAVAVGAAECINPKDFTKPVSEVLSEMTGDTMGYRFEVIGHVETMVRARITGAVQYTMVSVAVGAPPSAKRLTYTQRCSSLDACGRDHVCLFTGWESKDYVPKLVTDFLEKKFDLDQLITHDLAFKKKINKRFELLNSGQSIQTVLTF
uniref:Alcohol dehydrogenase 7 (class IV), mu or sigma polypeptide n=1 Tax=Capra hircus TaxID=9925 RepID=A0A452EWN2_CAPHI